MGEEYENTMYFARGDTIESAEVEAMFDWLEDVFLPEVCEWCSSDLVFDEIYGTDLTTSTSPTYSRILSPDIVGDLAGDAGSGNNACCISFRTNGRGRTSRGRNYIGGIQENNITDNFIDVEVINGLVAAYELALGGGTFPGGWDWVVISRFLEGVARVAALIQAIVDVLSTDSKVDSQRKRVK